MNRKGIEKNVKKKLSLFRQTYSKHSYKQQCKELKKDPKKNRSILFENRSDLRVLILKFGIK